LDAVGFECFWKRLAQETHCNLDECCPRARKLKIAADLEPVCRHCVQARTGQAQELQGTSTAETFCQTQILQIKNIIFRDQVLQGLKQMVRYLDDILITGESAAEHLKNLEEVLARLEKFGLRTRLSKCQFFPDSVEYLGHMIDKEGIHTLKRKVEALTNAKTPQNVEQLQSFLGMVNYYAKYIPNLSTISAPLNCLRQKDIPWKWTEKEEEEVNKLKHHLSSAEVLVHYNPKTPLKLDCDASSVGIGAVLSHVQPDGTEKPIAYASRSLT